MDDRIEELERTVATMAASLRQVEKRLAAIEAASKAESVSQGFATPDLAAEVSDGVLPTHVASMTRAVSLVGRSLLVLAGAFLLRAITDAGTFPSAFGIGLGLVYSIVWMLAADGAAQRGRDRSAVSHGVCSAVIAYPLIWEATRSFAVFSAEAAAVALGLVTGLGYFVAWRRRLRLVAWVFTIGAIVAAGAFLSVWSATTEVTVLLVVLGVFTVWIAASREWPALPWLPALVADVAVLRAISVATLKAETAPSYGLVSVHDAQVLTLLLTVGYLAAVVYQVLGRRRSIDAFAVMQTAAVVVIGVGGGVRLAGDAGALLFGATVLLAGAACYALAFTVVERAFGRGRDLVFFSTLALGLTLSGSALLVGGQVAAILWAGIGFAAAYVGGRLDRITLRVHAVVYATAAAIASGLFAFVVGALAGPTQGMWRHAAVGVHVVLAGVVAAMATLVWSRRGKRLRWPLRLPLMALVVVAAAGICAEAVALLAAPVALDADTAAGLAMIRTGVVSCGALALAALSLRFAMPELGWLVYPTLAVVGVKILVQDLPAGGPLSIAVAFVFYGAALVLGPRLLRAAGEAGDVSKGS